MSAEQSWTDLFESCGFKFRFDTFDLAQKVARRRRRRDHPSKVYHCQHCHGWHITTASKNNRSIRNGRR